MIHQQVVTTHKTGKLYNFSDYKTKKPIFMNPMKISIAHPIYETFYMVKNVVYREKQILALKKEQDPHTIVLVEGKIENGKLTYVSMIPDEYMGEIARIIEETI